MNYTAVRKAEVEGERIDQRNKNDEMKLTAAIASPPPPPP